MPIATSPYLSNDYSSANTFRPYVLPSNEIFRALQANNQFWDQGAMRVKSAYDNALGLDLTIKENRDIRDQYLKDAEKQLTKLSGMDLRDPNVQRKGIEIFKPLFKDEGVMYDDAMTKHYNKVRQDALSYRNKENGKGYHPANLSYALDGYNEFASTTDRMAGKRLYEKRKEYEPFYDPAQEINTVMKNCHPSVYPYYKESEDKKTSEITGYMQRALSDAKVKSCFSAGLSDRAKRQLQISGYVSFKNHPEILASQYSKYNNISITSNNADILALSSEIATIESKQKAGKAAPEEISGLEALKRQKQLLTDNNVTLGTINDKLGRGDYSPLNEDYEGISGLIYTDIRTSDLGKSLSYNEYISDPVQLLALRQQFEVNQQEDRQKFEAEQQQNRINADIILQKMKDASAGGASGVPGATYNPATGQLDLPDIVPLERRGEEPIKEGYSEFQKEVEAVNQKITDNNKYISSFLLDPANGYIKENGEVEVDLTMYGPSRQGRSIERIKVKDFLQRVKDGKTVAPDLLTLIPELSNFMAKNASINPEYGKRLDKYFELETTKKALDATVRYKEARIQSDLSDLRRKIDEPVVLSDGTIIKGSDLVGNVRKISTGGLPWRSYPTGRGYEINIPYSNPSDRSKINKLENLLEDYKKKEDEKRQEYYGDRNWKEEPFYKVYAGNQNDIIKKVQDDLVAKLTPEGGKPANIVVDAVDYQGNAKVIIPGTDKKDFDAVTTAANADKQNSYYNSKDGAWYLRNVPNLNFSQQLGLNNLVKDLGLNISRIASTVDNKSYGKVGESINIPVAIKGEYRIFRLDFENTDEGLVYVLKGDGGETIRTSNVFDMAQKIQGLRTGRQQ